MIPAGARCGVHVEVPAVDLCKRCGRFLCGECVELAGEYAFCADCAKRRDGPPSILAKLALSAGAASLLLLFSGSASVLDVIVAPSAVVMASIELFRMSRGRTSPRGRTPATLALALGLLSSLAFAGVIIAFLHRT